MSHCFPWKHWFPFASISHVNDWRCIVPSLWRDLQAVLSDVYDGHVHIAMVTSWYNVQSLWVQLICVCACVQLIGCLTHAGALPVSVPDIRHSVACHEEVHQALAENKETSPSEFQYNERRPSGPWERAPCPCKTTSHEPGWWEDECVMHTCHVHALGLWVAPMCPGSRF